MHLLANLAPLSLRVGECHDRQQPRGHRDPARGGPCAARHGHEPVRERQSEESAKLVQKLGRLQPFIALYSHWNLWANLHLLGQPNTFLAPARDHEAAGGRARAAGRVRPALGLGRIVRVVPPLIHLYQVC